MGSEIVDNNFFIYLDFVAGGRWDIYIYIYIYCVGSIGSILYKYGPLGESAIRSYIQQILEGLIYLHENNVIHRDLKSGNILLGSDGKLRLTDFGCAIQFEKSQSQAEIMTNIKGSIPWMAPEVIKQEGISRKSDIWSLGCTIIEMATARPPWGKLDNTCQGIFLIANSNKVPEIPEAFSIEARSFTEACLNRDYEKRPSARELLAHPFLKVKPKHGGIIIPSAIRNPLFGGKGKENQ